MECSESITNPVCEKCYIKHVEHWLRDINIDPFLTRLVITRIKRVFAKETLNEAECILCGRETLSTCSYCFFLAVARVLKELNFPFNLVQNFLEVFNYRHHHDEYEV